MWRDPAPGKLSPREDRVKRKTGFFFDERCFCAQFPLSATRVTLPVGGYPLYSRPPAANAESPETKRRMKNLMDVSMADAAVGAAQRGKIGEP